MIFFLYQLLNGIIKEFLNLGRVFFHLNLSFTNKIFILCFTCNYYFFHLMSVRFLKIVIIWLRIKVSSINFDKKCESNESLNQILRENTVLLLKKVSWLQTYKKKNLINVLISSYINVNYVKKYKWQKNMLDPK